MGDEVDSDYDSALPGAQTELAPSSSETEAHTAWSLDDGPEWKPPFWTAGRITAAAVGAAVVAGMVATGLVGYHLRSEPAEPASVAAPVPSSTGTTPAPVPPKPGWGMPVDRKPPATVTVTAPPPPPRTVAVAVPDAPEAPDDPVEKERALRQYDAQFLERLVDSGWYITNGPLLAQTGRQVCEEFSMGTSLRGVHQKLQPAYTLREAETFAALAQIVYPDCIAPSF